MATIVRKEYFTTVTGGRSSAGTLSSPVTVALGSWKASRESRSGISMPPARLNGAPFVVFCNPSNAASLTGWFTATVRAAQSPTSSCAGAVSAATVNATTSADAMMALATSLEPAACVDAGHQEARHDGPRRGTCARTRARGCC